jgi:NAD(P)-dependent dehydrogenase (short-subunit alcohol dehydrogenase family)
MSDEMSTLVVLITGALTGIGRAAALAFAKGGSRVVISGRHKEAVQALATVLHTLCGGRVPPIQ